MTLSTVTKPQDMPEDIREAARRAIEEAQNAVTVEKLKATSDHGSLINGAFVDAIAQAILAERKASCLRIADWISKQRNDVPAHGWEFAASIRELCSLDVLFVSLNHQSDSGDLTSGAPGLASVAGKPLSDHESTAAPQGEAAGYHSPERVSPSVYTGSVGANIGGGHVTDAGNAHTVTTAGGRDESSLAPKYHSSDRSYLLKMADQVEAERKVSEVDHWGITDRGGSI